jgi:hypothetical protein
LIYIPDLQFIGAKDSIFNAKYFCFTNTAYSGDFGQLIRRKSAGCSD